MFLQFLVVFLLEIQFSIGDTNSAFGFPAADTFTVYTAGSERIRVSAADRSELAPMIQLNPFI